MNLLLLVLLLTTAHAGEMNWSQLAGKRSSQPQPQSQQKPISFADDASKQPFSIDKSTPTPKGEAQETKACPGPDVLFLPTGFTFPALLPDAIYSYNLAVPVMALIEDDVKFRNHIVFPRGTRLVGNASALHTLDRVNINWTLAVLPEGCEFGVSAIAISAEDGSAGIKGKLEKHEDSIAAQVLLKSALSGVSVAANTVSPVEGAVATGVSNEANSNLDQEISKTKSLESINVHERTQIRVFVLRRFVKGA